MIQLQRQPPPKFWTRAAVKAWTKRWLGKECKSSRWHWPKYQGKTLNHHAVEAMLIWHHHKCAFCEAPLLSGHEVEHFRSKTKHGVAAFIWRNLFLSCSGGGCNRNKGDESHKGCLKSDREDPAAYLWVNPISQKMEPKPGISTQAKQRALITIKAYGLDRPELKKLYDHYLLQTVQSALFNVAAQTESEQRITYSPDGCALGIG